MELGADNRLGLWMCNSLLTKPLRENERRFVISIMQQLFAKPRKVKLSEKQAAWLQTIWNERSQTNGPN